MHRRAREQGVELPSAAQLPYSLVLRTPVEDGAMVAALDEWGVSVVASACSPEAYSPASTAAAPARAG